VSALAERLARLERQARRRLRLRRCSGCITWPSRHVLITELDADGGVTRQDERAAPVACLQCGWVPAVHLVEIVEVRNWEGVGQHGRW
jgi:hypothetical protein